MFNIIDKRYWWFALSTFIIVPGIIAVLVFGIPRSIDFTGGALFELNFEDAERVTEEGLRQAFVDSGFEREPQVVSVLDAIGEQSGARFQLRAQPVVEAAGVLGQDPNDFKAALYETLIERFGEFEELQFTDVGPSVGAEVTRNATIAVALACIGILIYLTVMFRNVPNPFRYGIVAIIALIHDTLIVLGVAALMGYLFQWEVDALFLTALLTVIGFSVHDSIVVFDRIRENVGRMRGVSFDRVVNHSVIQTLDRSINTQLTAIFTLAAIWLYAGGQLKTFTFWLIIGMISGTYSSIFNAAPLLVFWNNREWERFLGRGRKEKQAAAA